MTNKTLLEALERIDRHFDQAGFAQLVAERDDDSYPRRFFLADKHTSCDVTAMAEFNHKHRGDNAPDAWQALLAITELVNAWPLIRTALSAAGSELTSKIGNPMSDVETDPEIIAISTDIVDAWEASGLAETATERLAKTAARVIKLHLDRHAMSAAGEPEDGGWLPLETAPKDGSSIMLICSNAYTPKGFVGWWRGDMWVSYTRQEKFVHGGVSQAFPSHWRPLLGFSSEGPAGEPEGELRRRLEAISRKASAGRQCERQDTMRATFGSIQNDAKAALTEVQPRGWRPIETAPKKDWEPILAVRAKKGFKYACVIYWDGEEQDWAGRTADDELKLVKHQPTHWMPLPAAPQPPSTEGGGEDG